MFLPSPVVMNFGSDQNNKKVDTDGQNEFPPQAGGEMEMGEKL